jgi:hypothetical protein
VIHRTVIDYIFVLDVFAKEMKISQNCLYRRLTFPFCDGKQMMAKYGVDLVLGFIQ